MHSETRFRGTNPAQGVRLASVDAAPPRLTTGAGAPGLLLARRGRLTMSVLTLARARMAGITPDLHATIVAVLHPDDRLFMAISIEGLDLLRGLIGELQPRSVTVEGAPLEDVSLLREAVLGPREMLEAL